jgi:hypothetical protein
MTAKVYALDTLPGVQRDGTVFDKGFYADGKWVRFQRKRPRKMGGYRVISDQLTGPSRGIWVNPKNNQTNIFNGYSDGLQVFTIDNNGVGAGFQNFTLSNFTASDLNLWQFDGFYDVSGSGLASLVAHPGQNLASIDNETNTPVLIGDINGTTLSQIGVFTESCRSINGDARLTIPNANILIGAGQTVTGTGIPASTTVVSAASAFESLSSVTVTNTSGAFGCSSTPGLFVDQTVTIGGSPSTGTITNPAITGTSGTFSCTSTIGLYVDQPVTVTGTLTPTTLGNVQVTGTAGEISFTSANGVYVGMPVIVSGTLTGTATGVVTGTTYYVIGTPTTTTAQLSATPGGAGITTTAGTTTGLVFNAPLQTGITSGTTYFITVTNGSTTFTLSATKGGAALTTVVNSLSGLTFSVPLGIGLNTGQTYYIVSTNGSTTFTLSATKGGSAVTTVVNSTTGFTFTTGSYYKVTLNNNASSTAQNTLTFNNNVIVSGGIVVLHPYIFVYGNNGLIRNCSAGNANNWVSADANEVNVASGKIVKGLPVRGGSNSPSGLFWSTDSLIRVSYTPQSLGVAGTSNFSTPNYWRYDIITSQSSILSSQCVIEYDGIYYWIGVDRFMLYNGTVKEIQNDFNQNYFFDNLNYTQREKVWATKVPRFGEIWWFYPRGDSLECNDAIIYNIRENVWYDAGGAVGARRSAGYFSQVFAYPVAADWQVSMEEEVFQDDFATVNGSVYLKTNTYYGDAIVGQIITGPDVPAGTVVSAIITSGINALGAITGGSGYTNATYNNVPFTTGSGLTGTANIVVAGGAVTSVTIVNPGSAYQAGDVLQVNDATLGGGSGFSVPVSSVWTMVIVMSDAATSTRTQTLVFTTPPNLIEILQHEYGTDYVKGQNAFAIESYFETNDLGWVSGGPAQPMAEGNNRWLRLERVEPDFLLDGEMSLVVTGRPYAQVDDQDSSPYVFDNTTGKIDMKEQRRELRLRFTSNTVGGNYQVGKILVNADVGDVRGYS